MYNKCRKLKQAQDLRECSKKVNQLYDKIIGNNPDGEELIVNIGKFLKGVPEAIITNTKIVDLSREYCCREMNLTCYAQEVLKEKNLIEEKRQNLKEEINAFSKILKDLDCIIATKKFSIEERENLIRVIKWKKFVELDEEFDEVVKTVKMLCSTEIEAEEARHFFKLVSLQLKNLLKFLK